MKKSLLTLILCTVALGVGYAQFTDGTVLQPTHVVGKRINSDGEVTLELPADFSYSEEGKVNQFEFPAFYISAYYIYAGDFLTLESTYHDGGYHSYYDVYSYTYENGQVKTITSESFDDYILTVFEYYDDGRLKEKNKQIGYNEDFNEHWIYEYENDGKTVTESYYLSYLEYVLREQTTYEYDDEFLLLSARKDNYDRYGEWTGATLTTYTYTPNGLLETETLQTLNDDEWSNSTITKYTYDDEDHVIERLDGVWVTETDDWEFTKRIIFEISEEDLTYTVSFYKNDQGTWIRDIFDRETILFGANLKIQQKALGYFENDYYAGHGYINQFVFTLAETNEPTYVNTEEKQELACGVYPNPGSGNVKIESPSENAVVRFYDLQGRLVTARLFSFGTTIDTESWPSGIYLWEIWQDNQKAASGKWVKE